jgi:hypothetical protein
MRSHSPCSSGTASSRKKRSKGLQGLGEPDGVNGVNALVHVMAERHFKPDPPPYALEQGNGIPHVFPRVEIDPLRRTRRSSGRSVPEPSSAVSAALAPDTGDSLFLPAEYVLADFRKILSLDVPVDRHPFPALPTEELVEGHIRHFPLDVPQGHVDPGKGVVLRGAVPPVAVLVHQVPEVFDILDRAPGQKGLEILLHQAFHHKVPVGEGSAAEAIEPRLARVDPDRSEIDALRGCANDPDVFYGYCHGVPPFFRRCVQYGSRGGKNVFSSPLSRDNILIRLLQDKGTEARYQHRRNKHGNIADKERCLGFCDIPHPEL